MLLEKAIRSTIQEFGSNIILESRFVNILMDKQAFQNSISARYILKTLVSDGSFRFFFSSDRSSAKKKSLIIKVVENYGFQKDIVENIFTIVERSIVSCNVNIGANEDSSNTSNRSIGSNNLTKTESTPEIDPFLSRYTPNNPILSFSTDTNFNLDFDLEAQLLYRFLKIKAYNKIDEIVFQDFSKSTGIDLKTKPISIIDIKKYVKYLKCNYCVGDVIYYSHLLVSSLEGSGSNRDFFGFELSRYYDPKGQIVINNKIKWDTTLRIPHNTKNIFLTKNDLIKLISLYYDIKNNCPQIKITGRVNFDPYYALGANHLYDHNLLNIVKQIICAIVTGRWDFEDSDLKNISFDTKNKRITYVNSAHHYSYFERTEIKAEMPMHQFLIYNGSNNYNSKSGLKVFPGFTNGMINLACRMAGINDLVTVTLSYGNDTFQKWQLITRDILEQSFVTNLYLFGANEDLIASYLGITKEKVEKMIVVPKDRYASESRDPKLFFNY